MSDQKPLNNYDICIFGNTESSFNVALEKARSGAHTALIHTKAEDDQNFAPKEDIILEALYASATTAQSFRSADPFGIEPENPDINWAKVQAHIRDCLDRITPHYSFDKLRGLGVELIKGPLSEEERASAKDSIDEPQNPAPPAYEGLGNAKPLSLRDITSWESLPEHLIILGGDGQGLSLAQSLARLGCKTTLVFTDFITKPLDRELYNILFQRFEHEGIRLIQNADITSIESGEGVTVHMMHEGAKRRVSGSHLLVMPNDNQDKEHVFVLTDPSIAQIGLTENQAREKFGAGNFHLTKWRYQESDFAVTQRTNNGLLKIITATDGTVLGAGICGAQALELIGPWSLALQQSLKLADMQNLIAPHSAYSRMSAQAIEGYVAQIANPARQFKPGSFWQSLIGAGQ